MQFLKCETDQDFITFVGAWGPLRLTPEEDKNGVSKMGVENYLIFRRWLRAVINLIDGFKKSEHERERLLELILADNAVWQAAQVPGNESLMVSLFRLRFRIVEDVEIWISHSDLRTTREAVAFLLSVISFVEGAGLDCHTQRGKPRVEARWRVDSLEAALRWMVWYDEFREHPLLFCEECDAPFRALTRHARKFCSYRCAHRPTARKHGRKKRKEAQEIKRDQ
ncbi:MAG TPA: hypothetical protein VK473_14855 [Terriglobales bacterium]|nr:hypothetical protein [Terriglobales bacterium]